MPDVDIESDPLFQLLTDALRAGPSSREWQDAVAQLRARGASPASDEYQLLLNARDHLSSGRDYRTVRAGAGFTRKLFSTIDQEPAGATKRPSVPMATLIAAISAAAILIVLTLVAWRLSRGPIGEQPTDVAQLEATYFPNTVASATFAGGGELQLPAGWQKIGRLPLVASNGALRPAQTTSAGTEADGGGVVTSGTLFASEPFAVEADLAPPKAGDPVILEVFVSDSAEFSPDRATSPHELVFLIENGTPRVVVEGQAQEPEKGAPAPGNQQALSVRIVVGRDQAVVKVGDRRLWAGPHRLAPDKSRYAGVRFIRRPGPGESLAAVQSVRIVNRPAGEAK